MSIRLSRLLASKRICSNREAKRRIIAGKVKVNSQRINPANGSYFVEEGDKVEVEGYGKVSTTQDHVLKTRLFLCNKLSGELVSYSDLDGRDLVFQRLEMMGLPKNLISVGRLDFHTTGLILFTNNGHLARNLCLPQNRIIRKYRVKCWMRDPEKDKEKVNKLVRTKNFRIQNVEYHNVRTKVLGTDSNQRLLEISLMEGRNREVKKILTAFGMKVSKLKRIEFGPFNLKSLAKGDVREVPVPKKFEHLLNPIPTEEKV